MEQPTPDQNETGSVTVTTPDQALRNAVESSASQKVSAEDADRAKKEKEAEATKLMDDMEASAEAQGQYFVKIGDKKPITEQRERSAGFLGRKTETYDETVGHQDSRALILKAPVTDKTAGGIETTNLIVVTPDGLKVICQYPDGSGTLDKSGFDYLLALTKGERTPGAFSKFSKESKTWWKIGLEFTDRENDEWPTSFRVEQAPPNILSMFQESVQKSIAMVESPNAKHAQEAIAETKVLQGANNIIGDLPPRA